MMKERLRLWTAALCLGALAFGTSVEAAEADAGQPADGNAQPRTETAAPAGSAPTKAEQPGAEQRTTKRIAVVPVLDSTGGWLTPGAYALLQDRMDHEFHIPLNETMRWAEFIDEDEAKAAFRAAIEAQDKKKKPELAAREAARALSADLMACLVVDQFYEHIHMSWRGITYIESAVHLTVYGYDAIHDRLIKAPASRWEQSEYHPSHEVEELAMEALDEALRKADLRSVVFPLKKKGADA